LHFSSELERLERHLPSDLFVEEAHLLLIILLLTLLTLVVEEHLRLARLLVREVAFRLHASRLVLGQLADVATVSEREVEVEALLAYPVALPLLPALANLLLWLLHGLLDLVTAHLLLAFGFGGLQNSFFFRIFKHMFGFSLQVFD